MNFIIAALYFAISDYNLYVECISMNMSRSQISLLSQISLPSRHQMCQAETGTGLKFDCGFHLPASHCASFTLAFDTALYSILNGSDWG